MRYAPPPTSAKPPPQRPRPHPRPRRSLCAPTTCTDSNCGPTPDGCGGEIECPCNTCTFTCVSGLTDNTPCILPPDFCSIRCPGICDLACEPLGGCSSSRCASCPQ